MNLAERLKSARRAKEMSVYKLSQISGVSQTHIRDLERGDRNPSLDTLDRLAKPLGLSLSDLVRENEEVSFLNAKEQKLLTLFRALPERQAQTLLEFLDTLQ